MLIYIIATYAIHVALMRPATGCNITLLPLRITTRNDDVTSLRQNERSLFTGNQTGGSQQLASIRRGTTPILQ